MAIASVGGPVLVVVASRGERSALGLVGPARVDVAGLGACSRVELVARLVGRGAAGLLVERVRVNVAGLAGIAAGAVFGSALFVAGSGEGLALVLVVVASWLVELVAGLGTFERSERSAVAAAPRIVDVAGLRAASA